METLDTPVYLEHQVLKVSPVSQEDLHVQVLMGPKEKGGTLALEASLDHKVFLGPEGMLVLQVSQDRATMEAGGRMVSLDGQDQKASLEKCWELHQGVQDRMVFQGSLETRASQGHQEALDHLVLMVVLAFLD